MAVSLHNRTLDPDYFHFEGYSGNDLEPRSGPL